VRLESATYEIVECVHMVDALVKVFKGAKVVCRTVGPFSNFGLTTVEAALKAGCHYLDTTGEQGYMRSVRERLGASFRQAGLLVSPSLAYMYTFAEIAAELALETPGVDALETGTLARGPLVPFAPGTSANVVDPGLVQPVFSLPWGGTSLPVYFEHDPRVRSCMSYVGFYDNNVMQTVQALGQKWDAKAASSTSRACSGSRAFRPRARTTSPSSACAT
jgi:hypothetical protein